MNNNMTPEQQKLYEEIMKKESWQARVDLWIKQTKEGKAPK